jgi:hypothetical protein
VDFGYRSMRGWRLRRFPPNRLDRPVAYLGARDVPVAVASAAGGFEVVGHDLASYVRQWLEHGVATASVPETGTAFAAGAAGTGAGDGVVPILVTTERQGAEMVGIGRGGPGLADDPVRGGELLDELTDLVLELADDLAYAVVGIHETGTRLASGTPFREVRPATARALHSGLSLAALDQWVLDAGPVQLLTAHHRVGARDGVDETPVKGSELRLVRIGHPEDWFSGPDPRARIRNRGREALAACLPPRGTRVPSPLL